MNNFKFKFQKILDYKESTKKTCVFEYNKTKNELKNEKMRLKKAKNIRNRLISKKNKLTSKTTVATLKDYNSYLNNVEDKINIQQDKVESVKKELKKRKKKLIELSKENKIFDKLKEKHKSKYYTNVRKEEDKLVDSIVSFNNKNSLRD